MQKIVLDEVYNKVFLTFPKSSDEPVNMSLVEATLFALCKLARRFSKAASRLIGTVLIRTGQPGEADEVREDEGKQREFRERLENLVNVCGMFIETYKGKYAAINERSTHGEEEARQKRRELKECMRAQRTGVNSVKMCRAMLGRNPLSEKIPNTPSWSKKRERGFRRNRNEDKRGRSGFRRNRNDNGRYDRRERRH